MNPRVRILFQYTAVLLVGVAGGVLVMRRDKVSFASTAESTENPVSSLEQRIPKIPATSREFTKLSTADREKLALLCRSFREAKADAERLAILDDIEAGCLGREFIDLARPIFETPKSPQSREVRQRVLSLLSGNVSTEILPVLDLARRHGDEAQRTLAVQAAAQVRDPQVEAFIASFFVDQEKNVRLAALEVAGKQPAGTRERLFSRAMQSREQDVALAGLAELEVDASTATLPQIFEGLAAPNPEVREETRRTLEFMLDQSFDTPQAAATWWNANRHRFDAQLIRLD